MIEIAPRQLPALSRWFPTGSPGPGALAEHVLTTGVGHWWADRPDQPRVLAVSCADHVLLRGDPGVLAPDSLKRFAGQYVETPARFWPTLGPAFERVVPRERMLYVHQAPATLTRPPRGVTVRRLTCGDAAALAELHSGNAWIHASWGGPGGLAASGHGWAAFAKGRILSVACAYFLGSAYEDIAVVTVPDRRRELPQLPLGGAPTALACVAGLTADIRARGHTASWCCSRDNRPSRLLAWTAGFRLTREYVHHATGRAVASEARATPVPA
ncbi:GNAT family N-acetyltransferase [Streptomyces virginiae]|uniref:GNAT family N-acetyltransferase n=1 Tax=Streptomyces virginiae TaxID=1961 RepID=UPI0005275142|nr:GNAT family N-acetyltransferase [Streptomyces virginiae]MCX4718029.1 GNAT family N-acetyltransferase [Streptomyces virginiae]MCX5277792.1 GNAT family N-acetyltransferase [Streptomyces virginiae]